MAISKHDAIVVFLLSFFAAVPQLNLYIMPFVVFFSIRTLLKMKHHPKQFGGRNYALFALIVSTSALILSFFGFLLGLTLTGVIITLIAILIIVIMSFKKII